MPRIKKITLRVRKPFPLLKLPPEIRNHVWRYVVVKAGKAAVRNQLRDGKLQDPRFATSKAVKFRQEVDERRRSSQLAVAFTCRQLYLEVTPIYYGENIFHPRGKCPPTDCYRRRNDYETFESFIAAIGPKNTSTITHISLFWTWYPIDRYLTKLPGLKRLHSMNYGKAGWQNRVTALAQEYTSLSILYDGEVWGPDMWTLYPGDEI